MWFDRRFELGLPPEAFPDILERVRGTPARLEERVRGLATDLLVRQPERMRSVAELEALSPDQIRHTALHPRLEQPMTVIDLFFFVAEHDDHHLARISEILGAR